MKTVSLISKATRISFLSLLLLATQIGYRVEAHQDNVRLSVDHLLPPAQIQEDLSEKIETPRPHVVVALGGGGCKCVAQIGVLRSLEKHHVRIDAVVGSSMGSVVGALYCAGMPLDQIEELFTSNAIAKSISPKVPLKVAIAPMAKLIPIYHHRPYAGYVNGDKFLHLLQSKLPATFDQLKTPFVAVATDLTDGSTTALSRGNLPESILASNAFPIYFRPVQIGDKVYSDGGVRSNLPAKVAREQLKADVVVAVPVDASIKPVNNDRFKKMANVRTRAIDIMVAALDANQANKSDVLIYPNTDDIPILTKNAELMKRGTAKGEEAADRAIPQVMRSIAAATKAEQGSAQASLSEPQ